MKAGGNAIFVPINEKICIQWQVFTIFHVLAKSILNSGPDIENGCIQYKSVVEATRKALNIRFQLLPYLYTLFYHGWMEGEPVIRPLFYEYDTKTYQKSLLAKDEQFLWGPAVMFVPNMKGEDYRDVFFPIDAFYNMVEGEDPTVSLFSG